MVAASLTTLCSEVILLLILQFNNLHFFWGVTLIYGISHYENILLFMLYMLLFSFLPRHQHLCSWQVERDGTLITQFCDWSAIQMSHGDVYMPICSSTKCLPQHLFATTPLHACFQRSRGHMQELYPSGIVNTNAVPNWWQSQSLLFPDTSWPTEWIIWYSKNCNGTCFLQVGDCMELGRKIHNEISEFISDTLLCPSWSTLLPTVMAFNGHQSTCRF